MSFSYFLGSKGLLVILKGFKGILVIFKCYGVFLCDVGIAQCDDRSFKCEKKSKGITKYEKKTVTCDVGTAQCEDRIIKCEKKVRKPPNVIKELPYVMLEP